MNKPTPSRNHRTPHHHHHPVGPAQTGQDRPQGLPPLSQLLDPTRPFYGEPMTEAFVKNFLGNKAVVDAYFHPKLIADVINASDPARPPVLPHLTTVIPMAEAMRAATQAAAIELIKPHERALVHLATIVYPCGLFFCEMIDQQASAVGRQFPEVALMRSMLLEQPLKVLKGLHIGMGNTLAAVLGLTYSVEDVDLEQVSRIATVVHLANIRITELWVPTQPPTHGH
jgi:hypothetical protein